MMKVGIEEGQFPITIKFPDVRKQSLTVNAAIELRDKLDKVIDAQKEPSARSRAAMTGSATLTGFTEKEIKEMVDSVYGSCKWALTNRGDGVALVCYPNSKGEVVIYGE